MPGEDRARSLRVFVGMFLPLTIAREVHRAVRRPLEEAGGRRVPPEELHLTLHFLGATDAARIPELSAALARALAGRPAPHLLLGGGGGFPTASSARVAWIGICERDGSQGRLEGLARAAARAALEAEVQTKADVGQEEPWTAHLTVGRPGRGGRLRLSESFRDLRIDLAWEPQEVRLVESRPGQSGAGRFSLLAAFELSPDRV